MSKPIPRSIEPRYLHEGDDQSLVVYTIPGTGHFITSHGPGDKVSAAGPYSNDDLRDIASKLWEYAAGTI